MCAKSLQTLKAKLTVVAQFKNPVENFTNRMDHIKNRELEMEDKRDKLDHSAKVNEF